MKRNNYNKLILICLTIFSTINLIISPDPALTINLNPPEETAKDTISAIKDIDKLENDLRIGADEVKIKT